jgi:hypothetical protein
MMGANGNDSDDAPPAVQQFLAHSTEAQQRVQSFLDSTTPYTARRWGTTAGLLALFMLRIVLAQGWYIGERIT